MGKLIDLNDHRENKSHRKNGITSGDRLTYSISKEVELKISQNSHKMSAGLTSFSGSICPSAELPVSRSQKAMDILSRWKAENRLNLKFRNDISQIEIDDNGIRLGKIYWEFSYIFLDSLEHGDRFVRKFKLSIPTLEDIDASAALLPGTDMDEKRFNLMLLLGFGVDKGVHCKLWTSTKCKTPEKDGDIGFDTDLGVIMKLFKDKMRKFLGNEELFNLVYHYGTGIGVYEASHSDIGNICGIRRLNEG